MSTWTVILAVAGGSYAMRVSMFVLLGNRSLPAWAATPMSMVAPAAVAALVASMLFVDAGSVSPPELAELVATVAGFAAVRRSGNVMHAFAAGMPVFWILTALT